MYSENDIVIEVPLFCRKASSGNLKTTWFWQTFILFYRLTEAGKFALRQQYSRMH
jgi:hypothetical protein